MSKSIIFSLTVLAFVTISSAMSAMSGEQAIILDSAREGNLPLEVIKFTEKTKALIVCDDSTQKNKIEIIKLQAYSQMTDKVAGAPMDYTAKYLVLSLCYWGSTFSGAGRSLVDGAIFEATRLGLADKQGVIIPTQPDEIKLLNKVDVSILGVVVDP